MGLPDVYGEDTETAQQVQAMLDIMPEGTRSSLDMHLRQAAKKELSKEAKEALADQAQNVSQRLTGMREQLVKQEQTCETPVTIEFYHCDHLGTPIALTDDQHEIVWAARLDPWGNVQEEFNPSGMDQAIRLPGQHHDRETGLYYNRHRYYDPGIGSYINQDPIGLAGGPNSYRYTNHPLVLIDPIGLEAQIVGHTAAGRAGKITNPNSNHLAIKLVPDNEDCDLGGTKTLGGQPSGNFANGNLKSSPNYKGDSEGITIQQTISTPAGMTDCEFLKKLKDASNEYCNCLPYSRPNISMMPGAIDGQMDQGKYNSNSYVSGVINRAGGAPPQLNTGGQWQAPGYENPLPIENKVTPVGTVHVK